MSAETTEAGKRQSAGMEGGAEATQGAAAVASAGQTQAVSFPCGQDGVLALLPHRDPFVWVSRIVSCEPGCQITAELDVDPDLPLFAGHFPGHPVLPGVIIMEALAQAACCCLLADYDKAGRIGYLAGIDKAKFRNTVHPGDVITLSATITKNSARMCVADVVATRGEAVCAQATQKYVMAPIEGGAR